MGEVMRSARFEIVQSPAGWFARHVAANHRELFRTSEVYKRRRGAENAVESLCGVFIQRDNADAWVRDRRGVCVPVRYVDETDVPTTDVQLPAPALRVTGRCHTCDKQVTGERRYCGQCLRKRGRL